MRTEGRSYWLYGSFLLLLAAVAIVRNRSYDSFWHLATGRWIVEHRALPRTDPFTIASDRIEWINGEWLFQVLLYSAERVSGEAGLSVLLALFTVALFGGLFLLARRTLPSGAAALLIAVSLYGADHRLQVRPETPAIGFLVIALYLLLERPFGRGARLAAFGALTVIWINVHPSALLAPVLAGMAAMAGLARPGPDRSAAFIDRAVLAFSSGLLLLLNPDGLRGVLAPLHLTSQVTEGSFVNLEWLPSSPRMFPLLYVVLLLIVVVGVWRRAWQTEPERLLIAIFLGALAVRFIRNHGFFFAALPLLLLPLLPRQLDRRMSKLCGAAAFGVAVLLLSHHGGIHVGADQNIFPVRAVERLKSLELKGNIYNPDQFGGYLIWNFYPQRRVLHDGRNELFGTFLAEYDAARLHGGNWKKLLNRHAINLAVEEYRAEPIPVLTAPGALPRPTPASEVYFPRREWALVAFDDAAMVFAKRSAFPPAVLASAEYRNIVPDMPHLSFTADRRQLVQVLRELERAEREIGRGWRLEQMQELLLMAMKQVGSNARHEQRN